MSCIIIDLTLFGMYMLLAYGRKLLLTKDQLPDRVKQPSEEAPADLNRRESSVLKGTVDLDLMNGYRRAFGFIDNPMAHSIQDVPALDLTFNNLGLTLPSGKVIMSGVSGSIKAGRVTAIMGPSGGGKRHS